jgi:hypothetical protein
LLSNTTQLSTNAICPSQYFRVVLILRIVIEIFVIVGIKVVVIAHGHISHIKIERNLKDIISSQRVRKRLLVHYFHELIKLSRV